MRSSRWLLALIITGVMPALAAVPDSCERVRSDIQQKIMHNGVAENTFTLDVVPNDQADQPGAQVVGHCANDTFKILYTRTDSAQ